VSTTSFPTEPTAQPEYNRVDRIAALLRPPAVFMGIVLAVYVLAWAARVVQWDWPLEYRENAILFTTDLMVKGENPYALEHRPLCVNAYGIGYHWAVYPAARIFGASFLVHRIMSCLFIVAGCALLVWVLRREQVSWPFSLLAGLTWFIQLGQGLSIIARPDSFGTFLFLASLVVPHVFRFSRRSLVLSAACSLLGFLTKPYFILGIPLVALYLFLFEGKRKGILFGLASFAALAATIFLINAAYECYFTETFFISLNANNPSWAHLRAVGQKFLKLMAGFLVLLAWRAVIALRQRAAPNGPWLNIAPFTSPLLARKIDLPVLALLCNAVIMVLFMGRHRGNEILYYDQLLTPFVLWIAMRAAAGPLKSAWLAMLVIVVNLCYWSGQIPPMVRPPELEWRALDKVLTFGKSVYHAPTLAQLVRQQGKTVYDAGMTEYGNAATTRNFTRIAPAYRRRVETFLNDVRQKVERQQFDLIAVTPGLTPMLPMRELREAYAVQGWMSVPLLFNAFPLDTYPVEVWIPKRTTNAPAAAP
jgi:hypothetical protein